jgi:hypothetical protein
VEKSQRNIETPPNAQNRRVFEAKEKRRLEKAAYSPEQKMAIVKKLRNNSRALKSAKLIKPGQVKTK